MNDRRCPLSYEPTEGDYSDVGLRRLSRRLQSLKPLPFSTTELLQEAAARAQKMSVGGVQPKLSAVLNIAEGCFELVDKGGQYILKPQVASYPEIPQNEDVTMRLATAAGVRVPQHGLLYTRDGDLCYMIRRFDRIGRREKLAVEDFGQLMGLERETKYDASMERVAKVIDQYCTFPAIEHIELFRRLLVCYLTGNEDMHVKNFSILTNQAGLRVLSPAYDLLNSSIALRNPQEELALPLRGKKSNLKRDDLVDYFGRVRLQLPDRMIDKVFDQITSAQVRWDDLIRRSFLSEEMKERYRELLNERRKTLGIQEFLY